MRVITLGVHCGLINFLEAPESALARSWSQEDVPIALPFSPPAVAPLGSAI